MPRVLFMVPPLWIVSAPVAETPTLRPVDCAPAAPTTVALGVTVSILVLVVLSGTMTDQLPTANQLVEAEPFQNSTAHDGIVDARTIPSATVVAVRLG
jgi:hypothetical protein